MIVTVSESARKFEPDVDTGFRVVAHMVYLPAEQKYAWAIRRNQLVLAGFRASLPTVLAGNTNPWVVINLWVLVPVDEQYEKLRLYYRHINHAVQQHNEVQGDHQSCQNQPLH